MRTSSFRSRTLSRLAADSAMLSVALMLSYLEAVLPVNLLIPIPGFKLGLANIVIMICVFSFSVCDGAAVLLCRIALSSVLFGTVTSFIFSLCGGVLTLLCLFIFKLTPNRKISWLGVSIICASLHNTGQLAAAAITLGSVSVIYYLPALLAASLICGALTGIIMNMCSDRIFSFLGNFKQEC